MNFLVFIPNYESKIASLELNKHRNVTFIYEILKATGAPDAAREFYNDPEKRHELMEDLAGKCDGYESDNIHMLFRLWTEIVHYDTMIEDIKGQISLMKENREYWMNLK